jgi:hypothetical protein
MNPFSLPERGPFSACCGADVKVDACRRSAGRHSLSSTTSRPRSVIVVLDLARADYHPPQLYRVPSPDPLAESPQLMCKSIDRQSKQPRRYCFTSAVSLP